MFPDTTDNDNIDNWGIKEENLNNCLIHVAQGGATYIYFVAIGK